MSGFPAFAHLAVTVTDLERSTDWHGEERVLHYPSGQR